MKDRLRKMYKAFMADGACVPMIFGILLGCHISLTYEIVEFLPWFLSIFGFPLLALIMCFIASYQYDDDEEESNKDERTT